MMTTTSQPRVTRAYPATITLSDRTQARLRLLTEDDQEVVLAFARSLPEEDLLFLRVDLTDPAVVEAWLARQAEGRSIGLAAEVDGGLVGYASLHRAETTWQRHLGELRVQVGLRYRGQGLGRALATEIFALARELGLRKLVAQMPTEQQGARATFSRLGFQPEALLRGFVIDRTDRTHDLVVMTYDVEGLTDRDD
jgi:RimJ/RimL family protein N-acetyltransferase